jgi:hypothetical protein
MLISFAEVHQPNEFINRELRAIARHSSKSGLIAIIGRLTKPGTSKSGPSDSKSCTIRPHGVLGLCAPHTAPLPSA